MLELRTIWWYEELLAMPDVPPDFVDKLLARLDLDSVSLPAPLVMRITMKRLAPGGSALSARDVAELLGDIIDLLDARPDMQEMAPSPEMLMEVGL
jgi:hypothetical protein